MNFFGMTHICGPQNTLAAQTVQSLNMTDFKEEDFLDAFKKIDTDNSGYITIDEIRLLLMQVYSDDPPETEVKFLMDVFDRNKDGKVTFEEYKTAVPLIKEQKLNQSQNTTVEFRSAAAYRTAIGSNSRLQFNPQDKYRRPVTGSMEYGWYHQMPVEKQVTHPQKQCAETLYAKELIRSGVYF